MKKQNHVIGMATKLLCLQLSFMLVISCSKQNPCTDYTSQTFKYSLDDSTKANIPYTGIETLTFISNQGDTAVLVGQGKNNYFQNEKVKVGINPDCPKEDYYSYERVDIVYKGNNFNLSNVFYRIFVNEYWQLEASVYINNTHDNHNAYLGYYNDFSEYTYPVVCGNKTIYGRKILGKKDTDPFFIYNKSIGIVQIQFDSTLIYNLYQ